MSILALETATEACSVAIILADGQVLSRYEYSPRLQTQLLLPMVDELLAEAGLTPSQLTAIAYSRGLKLLRWLATPSQYVNARVIRKWQ